MSVWRAAEALLKLALCRCVTMLTNLYHGECDNGGLGTGTATIGSSEAIMLGGLAMKKAWQAKRKAAGKPYDKPNLVSYLAGHLSTL